jgi:hypothetical protein
MAGGGGRGRCPLRPALPVLPTYYDSHRCVPWSFPPGPRACNLNRAPRVHIYLASRALAEPAAALRRDPRRRRARHPSMRRSRSLEHQTHCDRWWHVRKQDAVCSIWLLIRFLPAQLLQCVVSLRPSVRLRPLFPFSFTGGLFNAFFSGV